MMAGKIFDLIIIGAGQAGLATASAAKRKKLNYLVLDRVARIGDSWRNRYDSLKLFTPRHYSQFPDMPMQGDPWGYPDKSEVADYLENYVKHNGLNVHLQQGVVQVSRHNSKFTITTKNRTYRTKNMVIATGPFQTPFTPSVATQLSKGVKQLHSAEYRNPGQILGDKVLVVGSGNSGAQIADELIEYGCKVTLSARSKIRYMPAKILGKSIFWWMKLLIDVSRRFGSGRALSGKGRWFKMNDIGTYVVGVPLKKMARQGKLRLYPGLKDVRGKAILFEDGRQDSFDTVIWATGFHFDYSWLKIPHVIGTDQRPVHSQGVSLACPGLFFIGLSRQRTPRSALLGGVSDDAAFIIYQVS